MGAMDKRSVLIFTLVYVHLCSGNGSKEAAKGQGLAGSNLLKCLGRVVDTSETRVDIPGIFMNDGKDQSFGLMKKELICKKGRFKVELQNTHSSGNSINRLGVAKVLKTDARSRSTSVHDDPSIKIIRNSGYLQVGKDFYNPNEYCFDQINATELSLFVCYPECYSLNLCVAKCCAPDEIWDVRNKKCRKYDEISVNSNNTSYDFHDDDTPPSVKKISGGTTAAHPWTPYLFSQSVDNCVKKLTAYHREQISVHYHQSLPSCDPSQYVMVPLRKVHNLAFQRFRLLWTAGVIVREKNGTWMSLNEGRYCVDGMANFNKYSSGEYTGAFEDQLVIACKDELSTPVLKKPIPLKYALMLLFSAVVLFITAFISCLLWDKQSVYEWTVSCEVISMFFLIVFVGIAHTIARRPEKSDFGSSHCVFVGVASHFFWLSTFCWLFIINFEIWWNFRSLVQLRQTRKWFRFMIYQLVGWGCPLMVVSLGLLLDRRWGLQNENLDCTNVIPPNYGQLNCYIAKKAQGPYIFYPIGVILTFNLLFYLLTVCKMWGYQKKSSSIIQHRSKSQTQPVFIFAKLFIVMGVSWIFELVSWAVTSSDADKTPLYWVVFDIVTMFQSVSIFVIFTWKKEVISRLWWKYTFLQSVLSPLLKLPGCGLIPNERDRVASIHQHNMQSVRERDNKVSREQPSIRQPPGSNENGSTEQMAFSTI